MSTAFVNALKRLEELKILIAQSEREMKEIEAFLTLHKRFSETKREQTAVDKSDNSAGSYLPDEGVLQSGTQSDEQKEEVSGKWGHRRGYPARIVEMAREIIMRNNVPMTRGEIAKEIERRGTLLPGNNLSEKAKYVGTILWRYGSIFENHEGKGYWPYGEPLPRTTDTFS